MYISKWNSLRPQRPAYSFTFTISNLTLFLTSSSYLINTIQFSFVAPDLASFPTIAITYTFTVAYTCTSGWYSPFSFVSACSWSLYSFFFEIFIPLVINSTVSIIISLLLLTYVFYFYHISGTYKFYMYLLKIDTTDIFSICSKFHWKLVIIWYIYRCIYIIHLISIKIIRWYIYKPFMCLGTYH